MRLDSLLRESADRFGQRDAIVVGDVRHSYAELDGKSGRLAAALISHGIRPGDRVLVFMDNSFEAVVTIFAVFKAGGVVVPVDPTSDADTLAFIFDDSRASAVVTQARLASATAAAMRGVATVRLVVLAGGDGAAGSESCLTFEEVVNRAGPVPTFPVDRGGEDAPALLAYASAPPGLVASRRPPATGRSAKPRTTRCRRARAATIRWC